MEHTSFSTTKPRTYDALEVVMANNSMGASAEGEMVDGRLMSSSLPQPNKGTYRDLDEQLMTKPPSSLGSLGYGYSKKQSHRKSSFWDQPKASVLSSVMNLSNTVVGAGILSLPSAIANTGYVLGTILILLFGCTSIITLNIQMIAAKVLPVASYKTMCEQTVPRLQMVVDISVGLTCWGVCAAYLVVIGDNMSRVADQIIDKDKDKYSDLDDLFSDRKFMITLFMLLFIIPTVRLRKMDALRFTSAAALICFAYVVIIVVVYALDDNLDPCRDFGPDDDKCPGQYNSVPDSPKDVIHFFKAAPFIIFAFTCHQNAFAIGNELADPTPARINQTIVGSISLCTILYCIVGFSGYLTFGDIADSNLLNDYPASNSVLIVRVGLSVAVSFSYPLLMRPARDSFSSILFKIGDANELPLLKFHFLLWSLVLLTFIVSMVTDDLGLVLGVIGSTGTTIIAFILPGLFYYFMPSSSLIKYKHYKLKRNIAISCVVIGTILVPFSIVMQFY